MDARRIAALLLKAHAGDARIEASAATAPRSEDDAYRIQDIVYAQLARGARPAAWKVGGPSDQVDPTAAPIFPARVLASPARAAAADFHLIGVEAEIAFRFARDLPSGRCTDAEIDAAVGEAVVAIELCDSRLAEWQSALPLWKLADNQMNWGLVVGSGTALWREINFKAQRAELWIGDAKRVELSGGHPYGNPFRLMRWAVAHLAKRSGGVRAGDVVTTGSWGGMQLAAPGDEVIARFPGIGEAAVQIEV